MTGAKFSASSGMDAVSATMQYGMSARKKTSKFGGGNDDEDESYFDEEEDAKTEKEKVSCKTLIDCV